MTKNVTYKICTCDICGCTIQVNQDIGLPSYWTRIRADIYFDLNVCPICARATQRFLKDRKKSFKKGNEEG